MSDRLIYFIGRFLLWLRYRISITGMAEIFSRGKQGILFLPNHPALIDPVIVYSVLLKHFKPRFLADENQVKAPLIARLVKRFKPILIPDVIISDRQSVNVIRQGVNEVIAGLSAGDNVLIYPSGRIYRSRLEDLRSNSAVEQIVRRLPDIRIVLIAVHGLWGSSFSRAGTTNPGIFKKIKLYSGGLLANLIFFMPRRQVTIQLWEAENFPRQSDRQTQNRFMEAYYNKDAAPNTFVPYFFWQGRRNKILPEPKEAKPPMDIRHVPLKIVNAVNDYIKNKSGAAEVTSTMYLAGDLGFDSLSLMDLMLWIEREFNVPQDNPEVLETVGDAILMASGQLSGRSSAQFKNVSSHWLAGSKEHPLTMPPLSFIQEIFIAQAAAFPNRVIVADQLRGEKTYRQLLTGVFALKPALESMAGDYVGLMLPASVTATTLYIALLCSGKIPVMINWTLGEAAISHCLELSGVSCVITASALLQRIKQQGIDFEKIPTQWIKLEEIAGTIGLIKKITALIRSIFFSRQLLKTKKNAYAVVLFTSGSESKPKAVPLTHANLLSNLSDSLQILKLTAADRILGMLPPFHSFGLLSGVLPPLCFGAKVAYHANPTEGLILSRLISLYKISVLFATPTFVNGIFRVGDADSLSSLKTILTGAEKCPAYVYERGSQLCPQAVICEGYGITECSPVVAMNDPQSPVKGSIGKVLPTMEYRIIDKDSGKDVAAGQQGMLIVRGPNVFLGYLNYTGNSPFIERDGKLWYGTGDLVTEDENGRLFFNGRLKRFVKIGGEMISLPAIEAALIEQMHISAEDGPVLAVEASAAEDHPEIAVFTTIPLDRAILNQLLKKHGLSGLHNIRRVIPVDEIPLLGSGKTNYLKLKNSLT